MWIVEWFPRGVVRSRREEFHARRIAWEVRRLFQAMTRQANRRLADLGINVSERAVLELLAREGPSPVPAIARGRDVSRQHVQSLADALRRKGLVEALPNPGHRRSPRLGLTRRGRERFAEVGRIDAELLGAWFEGLSAEELRHTAAALGKLRTHVRALEAEAGGRGSAAPAPR